MCCIVEMYISFKNPDFHRSWSKHQCKWKPERPSGLQSEEWTFFSAMLVQFLSFQRIIHKSSIQNGGRRARLSMSTERSGRVPHFKAESLSLRLAAFTVQGSEIRKETQMEYLRSHKKNVPLKTHESSDLKQFRASRVDRISLKTGWNKYYREEFPLAAPTQRGECDDEGNFIKNIISFVFKLLNLATKLE